MLWQYPIRKLLLEGYTTTFYYWLQDTAKLEADEWDKEETDKALIYMQTLVPLMVKWCRPRCCRALNKWIMD